MIECKLFLTFTLQLSIIHCQLSNNYVLSEGVCNEKP